MTGEKLRYHPSVILENLVQVAAMLLFMALFVAQSGAYEALLAIVAILCAAAVLLYLRWRKTTVQFQENEIVVERNTLFKMKRSIPYSKIASINVNRGIINRLFGTSKLYVNVNSSNNAMTPEAILVFKADLAERIRSDLSASMHDSEIVAGETEGSAVEISAMDVLVHGLFSQTTVQTVIGFFFLGMSIVEAYGDVLSIGGSGGGKGMISLLMFFLTTFLPMVTLVVHYANFKVYRVKDTIFLQHGLISNFRTSFNVSRINAIHVRSTMVSRLLGRSYIEAEVIGLGSNKDSKRPVLCLLKKNDTIEATLRELVPEFIYEREVIVQPAATKRLIAFKAAICSAFIVLFSGVMTWAIYDVTKDAQMSGADALLADCAFIIVGIVMLAAVAVWAFKSYRVRELSLGDDLFTFVNGVMDRCKTTMSYDKVQIINVSKGPLARRYGLAIASISLLSSKGGVKVSSGYFTEGQVNRVYEIVMERLSNGKYDYHKNEI